MLVENGLASPLCRATAVGLSAEAVRNCRTSAFTATADPTGDYAFDVNIDTGLGSWANDASSTLQDFAELGWMTLVALAHALVVMLEWGFSLHLATSETISDATPALHAADASVTGPWTAVALSVAAGLAAYHGLLRRRVAQTVEQALMTLAMMAAGLWMILSPASTVGALTRWSDEAATDVLGVLSSEPTASSQEMLASSATELFAAVVQAPWCYLEFGDVNWCESSAQLDPRLRRVAAEIARRLLEHCPKACGSRAQTVSAELLEESRTNGQLFLALPADEVERNSTKTPGTLLNVLCGGRESADHCSGPTAAQGEFRSERGTDGRLMGLVAIWLGAAGMLLLFGLLAVRLLVAAVSTLLYLLLAPVVALAPAMGERGRALFRNWGLRLLSSAVSKLTYAFLLGVLLSVNRALLALPSLGWWAQWCLLSAFWWTAFAKRNEALALVAGGHGPRGTARSRSAGRRLHNRYARARMRWRRA